MEVNYEKEQNDQSNFKRIGKIRESDEIDKKYGFEHFVSEVERTGWLVNLATTEFLDDDRKLLSAVTYYFLEDDHNRFKVTMPFEPYFYIATKPGMEKDVSAFLGKKYSGFIANIETIQKEDLGLNNHLSGIRRSYVKMSFINMNELMKVKRDLMPIIKKNIEREKNEDAYTTMLTNYLIGSDNKTSAPINTDHLESIIDIREHDVPFHVRVAIDLDINVAKWYSVKCSSNKKPEFRHRPDLIDWAEPVVLAFDIETTKLPLKFPDSDFDQIMMISYMIDGQGYLITNREIVSEDVEDFEYTPKPEYEGCFSVFNEPNELALLNRFFDHVLETKPHVFVTYNGDFFDWPFLDARTTFHGLNLMKEIGFYKDSQDEYKCRAALHMDCFRWVKRDSYLPMGSQNLKACTRAKLRYDPVELDPEEMCRMAREKPQVLSNYSVSDAVATYYLYMTYVNPFIFALSTIIPMEPDEVLRKGSGTLCEALLMVKAFAAEIIYPNKQDAVYNKLTGDGRVLDSETYVGGHVEALESGVFRSNIPCRFRMEADAYQSLIDKIDVTLRHAIEKEEKIEFSTVLNFEDLCDEVKSKLVALRDNPSRLENPIIYHLDVGAMYPNIILTNRLQPPAIVNEATCAACDFNKPEVDCQRKLKWVWRADVMPASRNEFQKIQYQLETEQFPPLFPNGPMRAFHELTREEQAQIEKKRLTNYCRKAYKRTKVTRQQTRVSTVCQRENSFYVDTVRAFRDRRYELKGLTKVWKKKVTDARGDSAALKAAKNKAVLYDSLQLAHKCILNSFYGYVMRKGSRWFSMEMAGIVCHTGANIITMARELIEKIGRPLELDTDGIWCILPSTFPENLVVKTTSTKKPQVVISYPGCILNLLVKENFTNHQYNELIDSETCKYEKKSENSIFFEVDGPYLAMLLPAAKEEGKKLKKRYVVFNDNKSIAELKGFEVKRRGELQLVKNFQSSVFDSFLNGTTLVESYAHAAKVADYWLDVLYSKGANMPDTELFELISENRFMSKTLEDYGDRKSTSVNTARRLAEFLGEDIVKNAGLSCRYIISRKPEGAPITERAVPLVIFQSDANIMRVYLRKWLKDPAMDDFDIRSILDWNYYIERLGSSIQKIITIPAALQGVPNPVPRISHPDWLQKRLLERHDYNKQQRINKMFQAAPPKENRVGDIEEIGAQPISAQKSIFTATVSKKRKSADESTYSKTWREELGAIPAMGKTHEEIANWVAFLKKKWRYQLNQKKELAKRRRLNPQSTPSVSITPARISNNLTGYIKQAQASIYCSLWQIVQIAETSMVGRFKLWVVINSEMKSFKLTVPHVFYVNQKNPKDADRGNYWKKVQKHLPRSHTTQHLYEYRVPEHIYQQHSNELRADFSSPDIEGVYETQVPLIFRALCNIGNVCSVNKAAVKMAANKELDTFDLFSLEEKHLENANYLADNLGLKKYFLYHYSAGNRGIYFLMSSHLNRACLVIVDPARVNSIPNLQSLYKSLRSSSEQTQEIILPDAAINFQSSIEKDFRSAGRFISNQLSSWKDQSPSLVCTQTSSTNARLVTDVPVLNDLPLVPFHVSDSRTMLNTIEWQKIACKRAIQHSLNYLSRFVNILAQCRYLQLPVGNLPEDSFIFASDIFLARQLRKQNHVMWVSNTDRPDLGGKEFDDNRIAANLYDDKGSVELNYTGLYQGICAELDISSLPINTIIQSNHINDMEGISGKVLNFDQLPAPSLNEMISGENLVCYEESALCTVAFRALKAMVHAWVRDVSLHRNVWADLQIVHFYRWLCNSSALLYDPALVKMIQTMMKKMFMQLIAEFKRLDGNVVYANFNKIVINTTKSAFRDSQSYIEYVIKSIHSKELFHGIALSASHYWKMLLWMDSANFGGIPCITSEGSSQTDEVEMNWNVQYFLPEAGLCQHNFTVILVGYLVTVYKKKEEIFSRSTTEVSNVSLDDTTNENEEYSDARQAALVQFCRNLIKEELTQKLLGIVQKLSSPGLRNKSVVTKDDFPILPGSYRKMTNPALEFINSVCQVLSVDSAITDAVYHMKRSLLKMIKVGEFSDAANYVEPCLSFILTGVICLHCNYCRDIDLCRDVSLNYQQDEMAVWSCLSCHKKYKIEDIEELLLEELDRIILSEVIQDLQCIKCKSIKEQNLSSRCECSGQFTKSIDHDKVLLKLKTFANLARYYKMTVLLETVQWIADHSSLQLSF